MNNVKKPSVLFVIPDQFGYTAGYYYYCKYLLEAGYRVGVVCIDMGKKKIKLEGDFEVIYVEPKNAIEYRMKWIWTARKESPKYDTVILKQAFGLSLFMSLFSRKQTFFDIRTGSVRDRKFMRYLENMEIKLLSRYFNHIFILSHELADEFGIPTSKYVWLPLGADEIASKEKDYVEKMKLLYVGTFDHRHIEQAVEGFALFKERYGRKIECTFDLIGCGSEEAENRIKAVIKEHDLQNDVILHGYMLHQEAAEYFETCNIGISYIPMIPCFENQPPTKTYEYVLSGLVCIGTSTGSNKLLITETNGVLHNDNPVDFCEALSHFYEKRDSYKTLDIKVSLEDYSWRNITNKILIPNISQ